MITGRRGLFCVEICDFDRTCSVRLRLQCGEASLLVGWALDDCFGGLETRGITKFSSSATTGFVPRDRVELYNIRDGGGFFASSKRIVAAANCIVKDFTNDFECQSADQTTSPIV